jgi:hypothetical protein
LSTSECPILFTAGPSPNGSPPIARHPRRQDAVDHLLRGSCPAFRLIDWLQGRTGKTDTALADEAGLQRSYLYRKRRGGMVLGAAQIRILGEFWGVPRPDS